MRRGSPKNRLLDYWVGIPILNLAATIHRRRSTPPSHPRKIGALCSPALGDTLLFSGALQDLRSGFPSAEIVHACMPPNKAAASIIPGADRRIVLDLTRPHAAIATLRKEKFDLLVDYTSWQRLTAFLSLCSGASFTAGFSTPGMYRGRGYDRAVEHRNDRHELDNFRALTSALGLVADHPPSIVSPKEDISQFLPPGGRPLVLLHAWASGAHSSLREWPQQRWVALAHDIANRLPGAHFGVTGTPSELPLTEPFVEALNAAGVDATAILATFPQLAELMSHTSLVVSVNTGVMHLAAIAGAPTVSLNGPTNNLRWGPVGVHSVGVQPHGEGCGYLNLGFEFQDNATDCMERISVDAVLAAVDSVLTRQS